jgi:hypothetical protein
VHRVALRRVFATASRVTVTGTTRGILPALAAMLALAFGCGDGGRGKRDCTVPEADCTLHEAADQAGVRIGAAAGRTLAGAASPTEGSE